MSTISLESSIKTCKVDTSYANKIQSDRFLDSCKALCPVWSNQDTTGRFVCEDSYNTKTAGCNSANDRIVVENYHRPDYISYAYGDAYGLQGNLYGQATSSRNAMVEDVHNLTGQFGEQFGSYLNNGCTLNKYEKATSGQQCPCGAAAHPNNSLVNARSVSINRKPKKWMGL